MMNSYFEQGGFYGQTTNSEQAAYRFPLGLAAGMGVSPYTAASTTSHPPPGPQHHQTPPPQQQSSQPHPPNNGSTSSQQTNSSSHRQDYDTESPKSAALYSPLGGGTGGGASTDASSSSSSTYKAAAAAAAAAAVAVSSGGSISTSADCKDQNGYNSLSKEVSAGGWGSGGTGSNGSTPGRPSVCTPDPMSSRYDRWMNSCTAAGLTSSQTQSSAPQLQQAANHTFYPWMAIAGKSDI